MQGTEMSLSDRARWDAVVIGAGPAGAVMARLLAIGGARVLLVDRKAFPRRKVCGACWNNAGLELLQAIGASERIEALGGVRLQQFHMRSPAGEVRMTMPEGLAVSRAAVDVALVQHAVEAGVSFQPNARAVVGAALRSGRSVSLHGESNHREGGEMPEPRVVEGGIVIAADGLGHPSLCELPEFAQRPVAASRIGAGCEITDFPRGYEASAIHMAVGREGYVGLVVVETGALNVAAALAPALVRQKGSLAQAAAAVLREAGCPDIASLATAEWRGTPLLTRRESRLAATRLFLVGDAAGYAEPFTGEGMTWAVLAACALQPLAQRAWQDWRPELVTEWTQMCRKMIGRRQLVCRAIAGLLRVPVAVSGMTHLLRVAPGLAAHVVRFISSMPASRAITGRIGHELQGSGPGHCRPCESDEPGGVGGARPQGNLSNRPAGENSNRPLSKGRCQQSLHGAAP
jgi:menaquinone-9 beta-reductase